MGSSFRFLRISDTDLPPLEAPTQLDPYRFHDFWSQEIWSQDTKSLQPNFKRKSAKSSQKEMDGIDRSPPKKNHTPKVPNKQYPNSMTYRFDRFAEDGWLEKKCIFLVIQSILFGIFK